MAKSVATIGVSVTARTSKFRKGMKNAQTALRRFGAATRRIAGQVAKFGAGLIAVATGAMALFIKQSFSTLDSLAKASDRFGIATDTLRGFERAVELTGGSIEGLRKNIIMMVKNVGDVAGGTGEAKDALEAMRLDAKKLMDLAPDEMLLRIAEGLQRFPSPTRRLSLAAEIFGSRGVKELLNFLNIAPAQIREMVRESVRLSGSFSRIDLMLIEQANDAFADLKRSLRSVADMLAVAVAPAFETASAAVTNWVVDMRGDMASVVGAVRLVVQAFARILDVWHLLNIGWHTLQLSIARGLAWMENQVLTSIDRIINNPIVGIMQGLVAQMGPTAAAAMRLVDRARGVAAAATAVRPMDAVARDARDALVRLLEQGLPPERILRAFDDMVDAVRATAKAALEQRAALVPTRAPQMPTPARTPTRFAEIDLSRTFVSGLSGGRRRKQEVKDVDVVNAVDRVELAVKGLHVATALMGP